MIFYYESKFNFFFLGGGGGGGGGRRGCVGDSVSEFFTKNPNLKENFGGKGVGWGWGVDGRTDEQAETNLPPQLL